MLLLQALSQPDWLIGSLILLMTRMSLWNHQSESDVPRLSLDRVKSLWEDSTAELETFGFYLDY